MCEFKLVKPKVYTGMCGDQVWETPGSGKTLRIYKRDDSACGGVFLVDGHVYDVDLNSDYSYWDWNERPYKTCLLRKSGMTAGYYPDFEDDSMKELSPTAVETLWLMERASQSPVKVGVLWYVYDEAEGSTEGPVTASLAELAWHEDKLVLGVLDDDGRSDVFEYAYAMFNNVKPAYVRVFYFDDILNAWCEGEDFDLNEESLGYEYSHPETFADVARRGAPIIELPVYLFVGFDSRKQDEAIADLLGAYALAGGDDEVFDNPKLKEYLNGEEQAA